MQTVETLYSRRLKQARQHADLSQSELARRVGLKAQAVQYLEDADNAAMGSRYTLRLAQACGVSAAWLETGQGGMLESATQSAPDPAPAKLVAAIRALRPELRQALARLIMELASNSRRHIAIANGEMAAEPLRTAAMRRRTSR